jgi:hypothetical protein
MDWSLSKLIRIENGSVGITTNDLRQFLLYLNITDDAEVERLVKLSRASRAPASFDKYDDVLTNGFREYLAYETSASIIRQFELSFVPGLLQTEEYARAVLKYTFGRTPKEIDRIWDSRAERQQLHDVEKPPQMFFILDESCLRRRVGGSKPVMRRQLERLKDYANASHVTLQILPFSLGAHEGMAGPFAILEFADTRLDTLVHLEGAGDATLSEDLRATSRYVERFWSLEQFATPPEAAESALDRITDDMTAEGILAPLHDTQ